MGKTAAKRMTVGEFLAWCPDDDKRWMLLDGQPSSRAPTSDAHAVLLVALGAEMRAALRGRHDCTVRSGSGLALQDREDTLFIPDLMVGCRPVEPERRYIAEPTVVVEILSPSTAEKDRYIKLPAYRRIASLEELLLIHPGRLYAEVHRRLEDNRWLVDLVRRPEARLRLESIGLDVALADIYAGVPLEEGDG
jgi:Uma2 family endonuclease